MKCHDEIAKTIADHASSRKVSVISHSSAFSCADSHLQHIARNIVEGKPPTVLWNIAPSDHFGVLQAVYFEKLRELSDIGCNCVVLLWDAYALDLARASRKAQGHIRGNAIELAERMLRREVQKERFEFVLESDLRAGIPQNDLLRAILSLSDIIRVPAPQRMQDQLATLIELYYESLIDADLVLTGQQDAKDVWGALRSAKELNEILPDYTPPLVISFPRFLGIDGTPLTSLCFKNSLSNLSSLNDVSSVLQACNLEFLAVLFDYLYFPRQRHMGLSIDGVDRFESLIDRDGEKNVRVQAYNLITNYFQL